MKKGKTLLKIVITVGLIVVFVWFLVVKPKMEFQNNEKSFLDAAKRYYELYSSELPTGERVKTLYLKDLYHKSFIKSDLFIPYTKTVCSVNNSWVKVRRENGEYKYYVYLECGLLKSNIDHTGPVLKLKGKDKITISLGNKFTDPGVESVVDNKDGKIDVKDVTIKGNVDTDKIGTYTLTYIAFDDLKNKGVITREVEVVKDLYTTVSRSLAGQKNFAGNPNNNYILFSNILFRIYGVDDNHNIRIVADTDLSNVNYSSLDKWLDYFYEHLTEDSKKMIVDTKFCNMQLTRNTLDTSQCNSYTKARKVYIPSVIDVNKAALKGKNFMRPSTISWLSNQNDNNAVYVTRDIFYNEFYGLTYIARKKDDNYGVRPMMTISKDLLIKDGTGEKDNPYILDDYKKAKTGSLLNERYTGEYVLVSGVLFRIIEVDNDKNVKVISDMSIQPYDDDFRYSAEVNKANIYNPTDKNNLGYFVNNKMSEYVDTSYFIKHKITVPIYKKLIKYGKEVSKKEYTVKLSPPNMYDLFSAH